MTCRSKTERGAALPEDEGRLLRRGLGGDFPFRAVRHLAAALLFLLLLAAGGGAAHAQSMPDITTDTRILLDGPEQEDSNSLTLGVATEYVAPAEFVRQNGGVDVLRTTLTADYDMFSATLGHSTFNWDDASSLPFGGNASPWNNLYDISLTARLTNGTFWDNWHYWLNAEGTSAFEEDFPGAMGLGFSGELAVDVWEGWMVGGLVKTVAINPLNSDLFGEAEVSLAVHVSQQHLRKLFQALGLSRSKPGKGEYSLQFALSGLQKTYQLAASNDVSPDGFVRITRTVVGAYLDYTRDEHLSFKVGPEFNFWRDYKIYNSAGSLIHSHELEPALGFSAGLSWIF